MESIICPTDFSENAQKATNWAAFLSAKLNLPLHLYNCYHIPVMVNDIPFPMGSEVEIEDGLKGLMQTERERLKEIYKDLEIITHVEPGFANESILAYANKNKAKLIVIGISGRSAAGQVLIGSTAIHISLHAKAPVLIIPSKAKSIKLINTAIACDFTRSEKVADIQLLFDIIEKFDSNIDLVHVVKQSQTNKPDPKNKIEGIENFKFAFHQVEDESVEPGLVHFTEKNNIDLLAVIHKNHGFFERIFKRSHTGKLAYKINIPLLVLHE